MLSKARVLLEKARNLEDPEKAYAVLEEAVAAAGLKGENGVLGQSLVELAVHDHLFRGDLPRAISRLEAALPLLRGTEATVPLGICLYELAAIVSLMEGTPPEKAPLLEALGLLDRSDEHIFAAYCCRALAEADPARGREYLKRAHAHFQASDSILGAPSVEIQMGRVELQNEAPDGAIRHLEHAVLDLREIRYSREARRFEAIALEVLGDALLMKGDRREARERYFDARKLFQWLEFAAKATEVTEKLEKIEGGATTRRHEGAIFSLAVSREGRTVATAGEDGRVRIWDRESLKELRTFQGHEGAVFSVAFSPDGSRLVSGGEDRTVRIWNADSESAIVIETDGPVFAVDFSPDGANVVAGTGCNYRESGPTDTLRIWNSNDGNPRLSQALHGRKNLLVRDGGVDGEDEWEAFDRSINAVRYAPDGMSFATAGESGVLRHWDEPTGNLLHHLEGPGDTEEEWIRLGGRDHRPDDVLSSIAWSPDGLHVAAAGRDECIRVHPVKKTGSSVIRLSAFVSCVAWSPDGKRIAAGCRGGRVRIVDPVNGQQTRVLGKKGPVIYDIAYTPDGKRLLWVTEAGTIETAEL